MGRCLRWLLLIALPLGTGWAAPAPLPPGVEADAREYTRLAMRHDQLLLKFNMHQASAAEQAEMERARASGEAIKAKYAPGRVTAATSAAFSRRLQELSREVIAPAARRWVAEAFPEPEAVAAAFPDDLEQSAALQVLAQTLAQKVGQPTIPEATAKIERYRAAWPRLNPQSRADYGTRLDRIDGLRRSKAFVVRVIERLVPVYANE
ncbi:MAG TPA: hypothetical protein VGF31_09775, partial [Myxococcaceae bacterium]